MPTTIESLELQVQQNATSAVGGIDALSASLSRLKNAVKGGVGLNSVANQVRNLDTALKSVDGSSADKINRLADSLSKLKGLGNIKLSSSIGNQLKNISSAASALNSADLSGLGKLSAALQPLNNIGKASGLKSAITQLQKLPQLAQTLNGINWATLTSQLQQLSNSLAPLASQLNTVSNAFGRLPTNIRRVVTATNALPTANNRAATSYVNLWAKFTMAIQAVRTGARVIASWITESNSYIENLNLFNASMGKYTEEARRYAEQVGELMGIDPGEFMRNQGIFMTITEGFGVASDRAYIMSKNLTQLGYDLSSFFNISFADAMQKLESGISGELEPLRRLGYDLSQARLQQEAWNLGIERNITDMTQAEKAQLRYYAIMTQVTTAQGDMARTLNAPANQLRILQSQVVQAARALGNIFIPILNAVLPYAIALAKVIRILANTIASFFGFKLPEIDYSGVSAGASAVGDLADNAGDAGKGLGNAAKGAKKLKNALLGIDELNIISPNDSSSLGSGGGAGGVGGIGGGDLGFELPEYDFLANVVSSKVDAIIQKMKEWLGLTDEINTWGDFFHTRLGRILTTVGAIGLGFATWKIGKGVLNALQYLSNLRKAGLGSPLNIVVGISLLATGVALEWAGIIDAIMYELNSMNFGQIVSGGLLTVGGSAFFGKGIAAWITKAFSGSAVATALQTAASNLGLGSATAAGSALGAGIGGIIAGLPMYFTGIWDAIKNGLNWLNGILIPTGSTMAAAGIGAIIGACGGPIGAGIGALIGLAVGLVTDGIILVKEHWSEITEFLKNFFTVTVPGIWNDFKSWVKNIPESIKKFFDKLWKPIKDFDWYSLGKDMGKGFGNAVKNAVNFVTVKVPTWFSETFKAIKNSFSKFFTQILPRFFTETIPDFFNTVATSFTEFFTVTLPEKLSKIGEWFFDVGSSIWDGIAEGWNAGLKAVGDFVRGLIDGVKEALGIHSPSTVFAEIGQFCIEGLFGGFLEAIGNVGKWVKKHIIDPIIKVIKKNPISDIVVGIKNTASDWWKNVKEWWADKTKDGVSVQAFVELMKDKWKTVKGWIGKIPTLTQFIELAKEKWDSVKNWIGKIPTLEQFIKLVKDRWSTVKDWIGKIPTLSQYIQLLKDRWTTVKEWVGKIPTLEQFIKLVKEKWDSVKNWIGKIPVLDQGIRLAKNLWSTVSNWVQQFMGGIVNKGIGLARSGWSYVSYWVQSFFGGAVSKGVGLLRSGWSYVSSWVTGYMGGAVNKGIGIIKSGWSYVSSWVSNYLGGAVNKGIGLARSGWSTVAGWVKSKIGGAVEVTVNLVKGWFGSIKKWLGFSSGGTISASGAFKLFSSGGTIDSMGRSWWSSIPKYAKGTPSAGAHGSMFVAGEDGAELVGHVNGTTEVLNRFQLAQVMKHSIVAGMAQFTGYWRNMTGQMSACANGIIRSILVSTDMINANLATVGGYDPGNNLSHMVYEDSQRGYNNSPDNDWSRTMRDFYHEYVEPTLKEIASDTKRQADKSEQTIVQVGNRTITDTVERQKNANGYSFIG